MKSVAIDLFRKLPCKPSELQLKITLLCGQSFRWKETGENQWTGVIANKVWTLSQTDSDLLYVVHNSEDNTRPSKKQKTSLVKEIVCDAENETLRDYFQLDVNLEEKYAEWRKADNNFHKISENFPGVRILRQDPVETLFAFICSSNNNIRRITSLVEKLCSNYGKELAVVDGHTYYSFPTIQRLAESDVTQNLRKLGFGYRAEYIHQTAKKLSETEYDLHSLRSDSYLNAVEFLRTLAGVGPKVADCVCLMALDKPGAIPIDTHVFKIAAAHYLPSLRKRKSLTPAIHSEIGDHFRKTFGSHAGWAQSVLFSADLKQFEQLHTQLKKEDKL